MADFADTSGHTCRGSCGSLPGGLAERSRFECCGWLAGPADSPIADVVRSCENAQDSGTHPTQAERSAERAYVIHRQRPAGPEPQSGQRHACQGYLSLPPPTAGALLLAGPDREVATSPLGGTAPAYPVQQLVVVYNGNAGGGRGRCLPGSDEEEGFVEIARYTGEAV